MGKACFVWELKLSGLRSRMTGGGDNTVARKIAENSANSEETRVRCPQDAAAALAGVAGGLAGAVVGGNIGTTNGAAIAAAAVGATLSVMAVEAVAAKEAQVEAIPQVVDYLQLHLGAMTTSYLSGADDPAVVGSWAEGKSHPGELSSLRLQTAREATRYIVEAYGDIAAQSWFLGMNDLLDEASPARVLRHGQKPDDWQLVVPAARAFVEHAR